MRRGDAGACCFLDSLPKYAGTASKKMIEKHGTLTPARMQGPGVKSNIVTLVIIVAPSLSFLVNTCPRLLQHSTNPLWVLLVPFQLV